MMALPDGGDGACAFERAAGRLQQPCDSAAADFGRCRLAALTASHRAPTRACSAGWQRAGTGHRHHPCSRVPTAEASLAQATFHAKCVPTRRMMRTTGRD
jgi:hypothetical protein